MELYLSSSRMKHNENFDAFSFSIKVLDARHGEMTSFRERLVVKDWFPAESAFGTRVCFSILMQLSPLPDIWQRSQCLPGWIQAEKTPGSCWSCCDRELVLRFSLLTSWKLKSLLVCDFDTERKYTLFQWNMEILLRKTPERTAEPWLSCPTPAPRHKLIFYKKQKNWRMWKDSEMLWGPGLFCMTRKFKFKNN